MISYIKRKLNKSKLKRSFAEYGYEIRKMDLGKYGEIDYAQWMHPFVKPLEMNESNVAFYEKICSKGSFILDIGAHAGDTTVPMALAVGKEGLVIGLEPNMYAFKILKVNSELNQESTRIIPLCFAATAEDGNFTFNYSDASFCNGGFLSQIEKRRHGHNFTLEVDGRNIQYYLTQNHKADLPKLSLIKIDAEGYDKEIIKTLPKILKDYKPALLIECYKRLNMAEREDLYHSVVDHGYRLFKLEDFTSQSHIREINLENMTDEKHFEMLALHADRMEEYDFNKFS